MKSSSLWLFLTPSFWFEVHTLYHTGEIHVVEAEMVNRHESVGHIDEAFSVWDRIPLPRVDMSVHSWNSSMTMSFTRAIEIRDISYQLELLICFIFRFNIYLLG